MRCGGGLVLAIRAGGLRLTMAGNLRPMSGNIKRLSLAKRCPIQGEAGGRPLGDDLTVSRTGGLLETDRRHAAQLGIVEI